MPVLPREGLTLEVALTPLRLTLLEPILTGPILAGLLYFPEKIQRFLPTALRTYASSNAFLSALKIIVGFGFVRKVNNFLSHMTHNNWTRDHWRHGKEIVLVTGGSGGIGEAIARALSDSSAHVIAVDLFPPKTPFPDNVHYHKMDITSPSEISTVATTIRDLYGSPTVIINNAGVANLSLILNQTDEELQRIFNVNILAHYRIVKEFLPAMVKENHGHVVTIASMNSYTFVVKRVDYCATKAAALTFYKGLGQELKHSYKAPKVRTTIVLPSYVRTPMISRALKNAKWASERYISEPATVANTVVRQLHSGMGGGEIAIPGRLGLATTLPAWPSWMQSMLMNSMAREGER